MRIGIAAIGRLKAGPERQLYERYLQRAEVSGKQLGFSSLSQVELNESKVQNVKLRQEQEGEGLLNKIPSESVIIALDEKGKSLTSRKFSEKLVNFRDEGISSLYFIIGGPDGLASNVKSKASLVLSFGAMTLPHGIARILLAEQLYRAITIAGGHPYHRD